MECSTESCSRTALRCRGGGSWVSLIYPVLWVVVVLICGATDGWVPYPFLDPATGYGSVAIYCLAIAAFTILVAAGAWAVSRLKIIRLSRDLDLESTHV
jgi:hypothetical protein